MPNSQQRERRDNLPSFLHIRRLITSTGFGACLALFLVLLASIPAGAQTFRFSLRADPDVIPANGISTASILVQVQNTREAAIAAAPIVRFITTDGTIESQTRLSGGVARVLLRSSTTPGTAIVTAFVGNAREQIAVEFSDDVTSLARYLELSGAYVAYGAETGVVTASGKCVLDYGDTHIESDVRLDVDLTRNRIWAEGKGGGVLIRQGKGKNSHELRGNRLFYDMQRRRGVMHRSDTAPGLARQEFMGNELGPLPPVQSGEKNPIDTAPASPEGVAGTTREEHNAAAAETTTQAPEPIIDSTTRPTEVEPPAETAEALTGEVEATSVETAPIETVPVDGQANTAITPGGAIAPEVSGTGVRLSASGNPLAKEELQAHSGVLLGGKQPREAAPPKLTGDASTTAVFKIEAPGSLNGGTGGAANPTVFGGSLREPAATNAGGEPQVPPAVPAYETLPAVTVPDAQIFEPLPPSTDFSQGYAVAARHLRVFPHDRIQFTRATLFLNGGKIFSLPRYVVPLNQPFNPGQDMVNVNSSAGITLNFPLTLMATPGMQSTLFIQHAPSGGFASEKPGFALAYDHQYWLSRNSSGRLIMDQLGRGNWNLNLSHKLQLNPTTNASLSLDMPEHRDAYVRASLMKDFSSLQVGIEAFYSRPRDNTTDFQGQFFARLRPRTIGKRGWSYTASANVASWQRYPELVSVSTGGSGGGVGLPGTRPGTTTLQQRYRAVHGETLDFSLQAPVFRLWKGASLNTTLRVTGFNQSTGRRGVAPGATLSMAQNFGRLGSLQLGYSYDKSGGIFAGTDLTHLISASLLLTPSRRLGANLFVTKSLAENSFYGSATLDYAVTSKWRVGLFSDYSRFVGTENYFDYGWTLGRTIGQREITLNWSALRNKIYFELGGFRL